MAARKANWGLLADDFSGVLFRKFTRCSRCSAAVRVHSSKRSLETEAKRLGGKEESSQPPTPLTPSSQTTHNLGSVHRKFLGKGPPFVDYKRVKITAGKGGDGAITFFKSARTPFGPPSGGSGGRGGDVYVVASKEYTSLNGVQNRYSAANGGNGEGKQMHGADGKDVEIRVPVGTYVRQWVEPDAQDPCEDGPDQSESDNEKERKALEQLELLHRYFKFRNNYIPQRDRINMLLERIPYQSKATAKLIEFDLATDGERRLIARGGRGGQGNPHFVSTDIKGPGMAGRGQPGTTLWLDLELKTIADAGLVGLPNAGKSTFLAAVSNAHPRIAPYPFTTLNPYVGTIDFPDFWTMTIADIPGLIEGAHRNVGLGHRFLRHVERNRILVYVIDLAGKEPWRDVEILQSELEAYKPGLTSKPSLIVGNKADLGTIARDNFEVLKSKTMIPIVPISAKDKKNITAATGMMRSLVMKLNSN
ncbi:hypothetical protein HDU85_002654 [Gaertneriomyces sp. JEL0708]|nr:hypothetical protein HDU85_002654 [Gaertneriomyces sp. JEL0708]